MAETVDKEYFHMHRQSYRMNGYDYSLEGAYFVTLVTYQRKCLFGDIMGSEITLSEYGKITLNQWLQLPKRFRGSDFSVFSIMPNHIHGIIAISRGAGEKHVDHPSKIQPLRPYKSIHVLPGSLGAIVRAYKASVTFRINCLRGLANPPIWQRNYYDHIIRNEMDYDSIQKYIVANPSTWKDDELSSEVFQ